MQIKKYRKREVNSFTFNDVTGDFIFKSEFKSIINFYTINAKDMNVNDIEQTKRYHDGTHHLFIVIDESDKFVQLITTKRIVKQGLAISKYVEKEFEPITYINYYNFRTFVQLDGMTVIVGMSGGGKTWNALAMLSTYAKHFNKIAYLNYELPDRDIILRYKEMEPNPRVQKEVFDRLYINEGIMSSLDLEEILEAMDVMPFDRVAFIVDNVGSVIGQDDNVYKKQNEFLKQLDTICKERGFHALALTQTVKDHSMQLFDDVGEIKESITMSIMSGSIMLGNLSRTVLFTGYNGETKEFKQKVLKKGTGKNFSERGVKASESFIKL